MHVLLIKSMSACTPAADTTYPAPKAHENIIRKLNTACSMFPASYVGNTALPWSLEWSVLLGSASHPGSVDDWGARQRVPSVGYAL